MNTYGMSNIVIRGTTNVMMRFEVYILYEENSKYKNCYVENENNYRKIP